MKKLLFIIIALLTFAFIGCDQATAEQTTQYDYSQDIDLLEAQLQSQIDQIEAQIVELQALIDNITAIEGLNGRVSYYINQVQTLSETLSELKTEKDYLDKSKLPDYLFDINGEFVNEHDLQSLLGSKYLGIYDIVNDDAIVGFQFKLKYIINSPIADIDEFVARVIMLVNELRLYDFYIIGSSEIYLSFDIEGIGTVYFKFLVQTLLTDTLPVVPDVVCNEWLFTQLYGLSPNVDNVQAYYDAYVLNGTFDGYVLNY